MLNQHFETLKLENIEQVLTITINRPQALNALSSVVLSELKQLLTWLRDNNKTFAIRGVIVTGEGEKAFIAGADIKGMNEMNANDGEAFACLGQDVSALFESLNVPVVAAVNGFALGGGCEMAMSCDFIYATKNAVFGQPEVNLGLIPGFGGCVRLPRYVGWATARELIYTGRNVKIDEAVSLGLVQKVFETKDELLKGAMETLNLVKAKSPLAVAQCKRVVLEAEALNISEGLGKERTAFKTVFGSEDKREGVAAFVEKRKANFPGK